MATLTYTYKGRDSSGKVVKGTVDAASQGAVAARLRTMGVAPLNITESTGGTGLQRDINLGFSQKIDLKDLSVMSRQMATMISAGLSLLRTLTIITEQTAHKKLAKIFNEVRSDVETGMSLSEAMTKHPKDFPPLMLNLIRAGETGGFLEKSLIAVADNYEAEVKLRDTIKSAMTYPVVVLAMAVLAVIGMILFIVPVFQGMFDDLGGELPLPTQFLVTLSENMFWMLPVLIIVTVAVSVWWAKSKHLKSVRSVIDPLKLRLPVFGPLLTKVAIARFTRNFGTMMGAGVPILRSLSVVGATSGNWVIEDALVKVQESVRTGNSIAAPLADIPIFPPMVTQMIAVGEDSGALEQMLHKISDFYDQEVESTTKQLTSLIEPLMIAFIGVVVGGMIVALYMPVFSIFDQIQ